MEACRFCGSTGDWECIKCDDPSRAEVRRQTSTPELRREQRRAQNARSYEKNRSKILEQARNKYQSIKHLRPEPPGTDVKTTLYRMFSVDGSLLYVGITNDFAVRLSQHRSRSEWFEAVDHWATEVYPTRRRAKSVETQAIRAEHPRFNRHESVS